MDTRFLAYGLGLAALAGLALVMSTHTADITGAEAIDYADQPFTANCSGATTKAYAADVTIGLAITSSAGTSYANTPSATLAANTTVSNKSIGATGVNGDTFDQAVTIAEIPGFDGVISLLYDAPTLKLAGLLCAGGGFNHSSALNAHRTDSNPEAFTYGFGTALQKSGYGNDKSLAAVDAGVDLFCAGCPWGENVTDDANINYGDGVEDGEVVFVKGSAHGGYQIYHPVVPSKFTGGNSLTNTITYTFAPGL